MKYISNFESYTRKREFDYEYEYLNKEDSEKLENFLRNYINIKNIIKRIKNLNLDEFDNNEFNYQDIFDDLLSSGEYSSSVENIYRAVDNFISNNNITTKVPAVRNSLFDIIKKIYNENIDKLKDVFDKRLVKLFDKHRDDYENNREYLNDEVKKECDWIIDSKKYNL